MAINKKDNGEAINMNMRTIGNTSDRSSGNLRMKQSLPNANQSIMPMQEILSSSFALTFMEKFPALFLPDCLAGFNCDKAKRLVS